jgi:hypothetical protein
MGKPLLKRIGRRDNKPNYYDYDLSLGNSPEKLYSFRPMFSIKSLPRTTSQILHHLKGNWYLSSVAVLHKYDM